MTNTYTTLFTAERVESRIDELADQILTDYPDSSPLFVALLRGASPFASKLMFAIARKAPEYHPDLDYMTISTYGADHTAKTPIIVTDLAPNTIVEGRDIVIIDDVIDLGITSQFVTELLTGRHAKTVKLAVLASKDIPTRTTQADYVGFEAGDKWLVGMGLDDAQASHEAYRWIEEIREINH